MFAGENVEIIRLQGIFFFLLGILGGELAVVLGLVIVQQGRECIDWLQRRRRSLSRPPSYNTVSKPPRYSLCGKKTQQSLLIFISIMTSEV